MADLKYTAFDDVKWWASAWFFFLKRKLKGQKTYGAPENLFTRLRRGHGNRKARAEMKQVTLELEEIFKHRDLRFTVLPKGACPVQAFGHIDGQRFYFRFRGNHGTLDVGPVNEEFDRAYDDRVTEGFRAKHGPDYKPRLMDRSSNSDQYYPHLISKHSGMGGVDPNDGYNGMLSPTEVYYMFSNLVNTLEDWDLKTHPANASRHAYIESDPNS